MGFRGKIRRGRKIHQFLHLSSGCDVEVKERRSITTLVGGHRWCAKHQTNPIVNSRMED